MTRYISLASFAPLCPVFSNYRDLSSCGIVDADIPALKQCLGTVGRNDMLTL